MNDLSQWIKTVDESLLGEVIKVYRGASFLDEGVVFKVDFETQAVGIMSSQGVGERFYSNSTYWLYRATEEDGLTLKGACDCGSKHTSRPDYHLKWCSVNSRT